MQKQIKLSDAKCRSFSLLAPVHLAKEDEKKGEFVIEAYTGAVVDRWYGKLAIEVSGMKAKQNIPILRDHTQNQIVGSANKTWVDGSFFVAGKFSNVTEAAKEVRALAEEGFPWQASIGVQPLKIVSLEPKSEMVVNGKKLQGPAEVWLESEVFETSFLPCGADSETSVSTFSRFDEDAAPKDGAKHKPSKGDEIMEITMEVLAKDAPALLEQIKADAKAEGLAAGAQAELERIQGVAGQSLPGHEDLINSLMYDGKTTGPEAAVAVLAAEKNLREQKKEDLKDDGIKPVPAALPGDGELAIDKSLPIEEQAKATWDKDAKLRTEFGSDFEAYLAFFEANANGRVRILKSKKEE